MISNDPVTTEPKGEALENRAIRRLLSKKSEIMQAIVWLKADSCKLTACYHPRQDEDIVYATRKRGLQKKYDVGSSHPGGGEAPKGLAVRQLKWYVSWV